MPDKLAAEIKRKTIGLGFYACKLLEEVGGAGLSHVDFALVERALERGSMAYLACVGHAAQIGLTEIADALVRDDRVTALGVFMEGVGAAAVFAGVV